MSQIHGQGLERETLSSTGEKGWERPAAADDIVDPIDADPRPAADRLLDREQTDEDIEDVPLEVKLTDALSMLADGGHDYGSRPIIEEDLDGEPIGDDEVVEIDESSKDA